VCWLYLKIKMCMKNQYLLYLLNNQNIWTIHFFLLLIKSEQSKLKCSNLNNPVKMF
jgi:hypothetical protein